MIHIPKKDKWETPEGNHTAVYRETRVIEKVVVGTAETVFRPVFEVTSLPNPRYRFLVSKNYRSTEPEKIKADFENWLGDGFYDLLDADGNLTREALDTLIGKAADLKVVHITNEAFKAPFVNLSVIAPHGTLTAATVPSKAIVQPVALRAQF